MTRLNKQISLSLTTGRIQPGRSILRVLVACVCVSFATHAASLKFPSDYELERIAGVRLESGVSKVTWKCGEPSQSNILVYSASRWPIDDKAFRDVADYFGVRGEIKPMPEKMIHAPGIWIQEMNPTNSSKYRSVCLSHLSGKFFYSSGDDGFRWDLKTHQPLMRGVPTSTNALMRSLDLLRIFHLSTNDLEHFPNGKLRWTTSTTDVGYNSAADKSRQKATVQRNVTFFQRVPNGGKTTSVGDGGQLRFSFVSEEKVSAVELMFRKLNPIGEVKPMTSKQIMSALKKGNAWTWKGGELPKSLTVTNSELVYPQGNSGTMQEQVWPFYLLTATSDGKTVPIFVPIQ